LIQVTIEKNANKLFWSFYTHYYYNCRNYQLNWAPSMTNYSGKPEFNS